MKKKTRKQFKTSNESYFWMSTNDMQQISEESYQETSIFKKGKSKPFLTKTQLQAKEFRFSCRPETARTDVPIFHQRFLPRHVAFLNNPPRALFPGAEDKSEDALHSETISCSCNSDVLTSKIILKLNRLRMSLSFNPSWVVGLHCIPDLPIFSLFLFLGFVPSALNTSL